MGIRLTFLSFWTPNYIISKELDRIFNHTTNSLKLLLQVHASSEYFKIANEIELPKGNIIKKRTAMAKSHALLVDALSNAVGPDRAINLGREALFEVGKRLGKETRNRLGIGNNSNDLIKAAKIMYRVLGIDFEVQWQGKKKGTLIVNRCEMAKEYSELTCHVLSATDEGVIKGLESNVSMIFTERMTSGYSKCIAQIEFS